MGDTLESNYVLYFCLFTFMSKARLCLPNQRRSRPFPIPQLSHHLLTFAFLNENDPESKKENQYTLCLPKRILLGGQHVSLTRKYCTTSA
ncbi:hypothetical protein PoB_003731700 [Plakobranchus ocellatus]|uniref:Uncharacterized protein n=1 Tax=Plakobranchus ocellatus TaxID=259542 RepID=A0AAV4AUX7_9GAST|nr:hypothetical protein PoB_003731700 [Plakobranchus ocellatus]